MRSKIKKVAVIMGGASSEREVSIRSGKAIVEGLKGSGYEVEEVLLKSENEKEVMECMDKTGPDIVFIALHGKFGEDGKIQKLLEESGIPYTGSGVFSSNTSLDKIKSKKCFMQENIRTPDFEIIDCDNPSRAIKLKFPLVIKPPLEGSSIGVTIVNTKKDYVEGIKNAFKFENEGCVLVEEFIAGKELTVGILDEEPLPVINIVPKSGTYDYKSKYSKGMTEYIVPAKIPSRCMREAQHLGLETFKALRCYGFARIDMILGEDKLCYVLEVNTIPGFTETSLLPKAAKSRGIDFKELCERILLSGFERFLRLRTARENAVGF
ncbi:MAG: D-alanine--D-alanine ligase [Candidatus Aureabacteria bacterium]|nr:D-alanine--D-alanine ligase [Candidatus Auribacterota bacterium]